MQTENTVLRLGSCSGCSEFSLWANFDAFVMLWLSTKAFVIQIELHREKKLSSWFLSGFNTNRAVQLQNMARRLKVCILEVEGLYYLCSENKGANQLLSYCTADLRLCFSICKKQVFSWCGSNMCLFLLLQYRPPRDLDSKATIRIGDREFECEGNDLELISVLGRGAYGVVEKMRHRITDTILAVKVRLYRA